MTSISTNASPAAAFHALPPVQELIDAVDLRAGSYQSQFPSSALRTGATTCDMDDEQIHALDQRIYSGLFGRNGPFGPSPSYSSQSHYPESLSTRPPYVEPSTSAWASSPARYFPRFRGPSPPSSPGSSIEDAQGSDDMEVCYPPSGCVHHRRRIMEDSTSHLPTAASSSSSSPLSSGRTLFSPSPSTEDNLLEDISSTRSAKASTKKATPSKAKAKIIGAKPGVQNPNYTRRREGDLVYDGPNEVKKRKAWSNWELEILRAAIVGTEERWGVQVDSQEIPPAYSNREFWSEVYNDCKTDERFSRSYDGMLQIAGSRFGKPTTRDPHGKKRATKTVAIVA